MNAERSISTTDQVALAIEVFDSETPTCLIINPAIGVKRKLYRAFATFMAEHGVTTILYNYRGMEDGLADMPAGVKLNTESWGRLDQTAVIDWTKTEFKPHKLWVLGHSIGGQLLGFAKNLDSVDGLIHVAAQKGDKKLWPGAGRLKLFFLWHVLIPLMSRKHSFAASKLGLGTYPWPAQAARQWASWGQQKDYLFNAKFGFDLSPWHQFDKPLLSFGFTDDDMAPETAIDGLLQEYGKSLSTNGDLRHIEKRIIDPHNLGLKHIGHFGFFKPEAKPLWQNTVTWIQDN